MYDLKHIAQELGFPLDDVKMIVNVVFEDTEKSMQEIEKMYEKKAWKQIAYEVHSIKGSAANMKLTKLSQLALQLEQSAQDEDAQKVSVLINAIKENLSLLQEALNL